MKRRTSIRLIGIAIALVMAMTILMPVAASARSKRNPTGTRNTAIALTAASAYLLSRGKTGAGLVAGAGALVAWDRYGDARDHQKRYSRYYSNDRYRYYDRDRHRYVYYRDRDRDRDKDWRKFHDRDDRDWKRFKSKDRGLHKGWDRGKHLGHYKQSNWKHRR